MHKSDIVFHIVKADFPERTRSYSFLITLGVVLLMHGNIPGFPAWIVGALFVPTLAIALGVWTGTNKTFEVIFLVTMFVGLLNNVQIFDFMGVLEGSLAAGIPFAYLIITMVLLSLPCWAESSALKYNGFYRYAPCRRNTAHPHPARGYLLLLRLRVRTNSLIEVWKGGIMQNRIKERGILLLLMLIASFMCWGEEKNATQRSQQPVELRMWLAGDTVPDYALMLTELNKKLKKELNITLKVNFTTWNDWQTKLRLVLTSGEPVDLVHSAPWGIYFEQAQLEAFLPLETLAPRYAPRTWASYSVEVRNQAKVNGHMYMLPFHYDDPYGNGYVYRLDLAEKYNLKPVSSFRDLEKYLKILKEKTGMLPYNAGEWDRQVFPEITEYSMPAYKKIAREELLDGIIRYAYIYHDNPREIVFQCEEPSFIQAIKKNREFFKAGYWSKNILANKVGSREAFINGSSAITLLNPINANEVYLLLKEKNPDWKLGWWNPASEHKSIIKNPAVNNGMSIPVTSKNPEKAMQVLEKLHQDQAYADLTTYGIRGIHWELDEKGDIIYPDGTTADTTGFPWDRPCPWGWREAKFYRTSPLKYSQSWPAIKDWLTYLKKIGAERKYMDFTFDKTKVSVEFAAIESVTTEYYQPLIWGISGDPEKAYREMMNKYKEAGLDKLKAELKLQWINYIADKK